MKRSAYARVVLRHFSGVVDRFIIIVVLNIARILHTKNR